MSSSDEQAGSRILEEAARWLEKIERTLSNEEAQALRLWLKPVPHRQTIVDRCKRWHGPEILAVLAELVPVETFAERVEPQYGRIVIGIFFGISAIGLITLFAAFARISPGADARGNPLRGEAIVQTGIGERKTFESPDGGSLVLNTDTRALLSYSPRARDVTLLNGEAVFDAKDDPVRPFGVFVGGRRIEVLPGGARFNVRKTAPDQVALTVLRGRVRISEGRRASSLSPALRRMNVTHGSHVLGAFEGGTLGAGWQSVWKLSKAEADQRTAWHSGRMIFDNEVLEDALHEIERYTTVRFEFSAHELRHARVSAVFRLGDVAAVTRYLREHLGIGSSPAGVNTIALSRTDGAASMPIDCLRNDSCRRLDKAPNVRFLYALTETQ